MARGLYVARTRQEFPKPNGMELLSDLGHFPKHKVEGATGCKTLIISRLKKGMAMNALVWIV